MLQFRWLIPILFFILVYIEVSVFVAVVNSIGVFFSLLAILATTSIGIGLARHQGMNNAQSLKAKLAVGESPLAEVTKNFSYIIAGLLFLFPGFFTDIIAVILLIPFVQNHLIKRFIRYAKFTAKQPYGKNQDTTHSSMTIEGEYSRKEDGEETTK